MNEQGGAQGFVGKRRRSEAEWLAMRMSDMGLRHPRKDAAIQFVSWIVARDIGSRKELTNQEIDFVNHVIETVEGLRQLYLDRTVHRDKRKAA